MFEKWSTVEGAVAVLELAAALGRLDRDLDDAARVDRIRALEVLKAVAAAAQVRDAADLDASQRLEQKRLGVPAAELGRGVAAQVALARRDSPYRGGRHLGLAKALVHEMPCTLAALSAGRISEWRATILVRETAVLTRADRAAVDREVAGDPGTLERLGDRALAAAVKQAAYRLDALSVVTRNRRAENERRVSIRPAPDTMAYLTALLPVRQAVAVQVTLSRAADAARSSGDERGRGQLMADTLVAAVTNPPEREAAAQTGGQQLDATNDGAGVPLARATRPGPADAAVRLVMTDRSLLGGDNEPAVVEGYGPVPAVWARELLATTLDDGGRVFVRRLLTDPAGALVAMESRSRLAPAGLADLVRARDGTTCRTPWCDAPVRHVDHVRPHADGGSTTDRNLQGLCEACNHAKQAPGWQASVQTPAPGRPHTVDLRTPTRHTHRSVAPPLPGARELREHPVDPTRHSPVEEWLRTYLALAA